MKFISTAALTLALALAVGPLHAETTSAKPITAQQQKMKDCNAHAVGKKGDERRAFMSTCLKGGSTVSAPSAAAVPASTTTPAAASSAAAPAGVKSSQHATRKTCNAQAKGTKGAERKALIASCLKGDSVATTH